MTAPPPSRAVVYLTWGESEIDRVLASIRSPSFPEADIFWITDVTPPNLPERVTLLPAAFSITVGNLAKTDLGNYLPRGYEVYLFLDSDT